MSTKKINDVIGSIEFRKFFDQIPQNDPRKKEFLEVFKILKEDCLRGNKIPHDRWPVTYIRKYRIKNLWRYPLRSGWRVVYTILVKKMVLSFVFLKLFHIKIMRKDLITSLQ